jgi:trehalose 6-phosphate phosphatase
VLNVLPHEFPNKGDAIRALVVRECCTGALYVGDDVTDEDVFEVGAPLVFGVHVGRGPSLAPWRLAGQEDVDDLLEVLLAARARPAVRRGPARRARADGRRRRP